MTLDDQTNRPIIKLPDESGFGSSMHSASLVGRSVMYMGPDVTSSVARAIRATVDNLLWWSQLKHSRLSGGNIYRAYHPFARTPYRRGETPGPECFNGPNRATGSPGRRRTSLERWRLCECFRGRNALRHTVSGHAVCIAQVRESSASSELAPGDDNSWTGLTHPERRPAEPCCWALWLSNQPSRLV